MKRRIFLSLMVIAIAAALVAGATIAYFSDVESANGTLTAGTLDLRVNDKDGNVALFNLDNIYPGYSTSGYITLSNVGSLSGILKITSVSVENKENGLTEPEIEAGDKSDKEGELGDLVKIKLTLQNNGPFSLESPEATEGVDLSCGPFGFYYDGTINGLKNLSRDITTLNAKSSVKIKYEITWPDGGQNDNKAQGDSCSFTINFSLKQK